MPATPPTARYASSPRARSGLPAPTFHPARCVFGCDASHLSFDGALPPRSAHHTSCVAGTGAIQKCAARTCVARTCVARDVTKAWLDERLREAQAGDDEAFADLVRMFRPRLRRYVRRYLLTDLSSTQDIAQETLISAWRQLASIRNGKHLVPWLYAVARNKAVSLSRRRRVPGRDAAPLDNEPIAERRDRTRAQAHPQSAAPGTDLLGALVRAVDQLPDHYRAVIRLYYLEGLGTEDIGLALGLTRSNVKMRLMRARQRLRSEMPRTVREAGTGAQRDLHHYLQERDVNAHRNNHTGTRGGGIAKPRGASKNE